MNSEADHELFNSASQKWKDGDLESALSIVTSLILKTDRDNADLAAYYSLRGGIYQELGVLSAAGADFKQLVMIKPASRLASAFYYNALIESDNLTEANLEGLRFLATIENRFDLTVDTQSYVDTILSNLFHSEDWSKNLLPKEIEMVTARRKAREQV